MLPKLLRYSLLAVIAVFGSLLVLRALLGPLCWPVRMNSPLNAAAFAGVAAVIAFALGSAHGAARCATKKTASSVSEPRPSGSGGAPTWLSVSALSTVVAAAYARAIGFYFLSDDFIIVQLGRTFDYHLVRLLTTGGGDGFYRPLGYISLGLTGLFAGANPMLWHAATLAVHLANTLLVFALASRLLPSRTGAFVAAALFAIHGTRPEVAVWIAGRFDLLATFFVLAGLVLFLRGGKALAFACMVLGILSKESAYAFPLLLVLLLWWAGERKWRPYAALWPYFAAAAVLFAYRWVLFNGIGGYPDIFSWLGPLKALGLRIWAILFFPLNWGVQPGIVLGLLMAAYVAALLALAAHRGRFGALPAVLFVVIACLPAMNQLLISANLYKSRMLYLPSAGWCLLLGGALAQLAHRRGRVLCAAAVLLFHLGALEHNLGAWAQASNKSRRACEAAARCGVPGSPPEGLPDDLRGVPFFANGFGSCVSMLQQPAGVNPGALVWDAAAEELRCEGATAEPARPR